MPSAARQRIPAELWRSNHNRLSGSSPIALLHSQDMQAHPGQCDMSVSDIDGLKIQNGKKSVLAKSSKKCCPGNRKNGLLIPRRGSCESLNVICENSTKSSCEMSTSPDSDSGLYYSELESSDSFALDSTEAPHPNLLPLPPVEWLKPKDRDSGSPVESLHSLLNYFASAQKCV